MGALHDGHLALIREARRQGGDSGTVVVSIFVNPMQFGRGEDFGRYPRMLSEDLKVCRAAGADMVFAPTIREVFPDPLSVYVDESRLSRRLCGAARPGHFRGVCTVVAKLFHLVAPEIAIFGEKDWQQLAVVRRMVKDLNFAVEVIGVPTIREPDGLAMSSRNRNLSPAERQAAAGIPEAMNRAIREATSAAGVRRLARKYLSRVPGGRVEYVEVVDSESLEPMKDASRGGRLMVAYRFPSARLIDNLPVPAE